MKAAHRAAESITLDMYGFSEDEVCLLDEDIRQYSAIIENEYAEVVEALERAKILLRCLTVRQIIESGNTAIKAAGYDPWIINEGKATGDEHPDFWWIDAAIAKAKGEA